MKVVMAASEAVPFAKVGGLGDVVGALSTELPALGVELSLFLPLYRGLKKKYKPTSTGVRVKLRMGKQDYEAEVLRLGEVYYFIECDEFFDRTEVYGTEQGEYHDNAYRFAFFSRAVLEASIALELNPDVLHCHDWQTAIIPLYLKTLYKSTLGSAKSILTIHNLGYQGVFPASAYTLLGLPREHFNERVLEFYGQVNLLKAGIVEASEVTTVSPSYALEIMQPEYGCGLDGVLKSRHKNLLGIINGIDYHIWNPATDPAITKPFDGRSLYGKAACKKALVKEAGFVDANAPLVAMVGRLVEQKGMEQMVEAAVELIEDGANLAILGKGDEIYQNAVKKLARVHPGRVYYASRHDEEMAHRVFAGADMLLMPSKYEPCGLTQMIAMRYGTVPVCRATGGIKDTVKDYRPGTGQGTGFLFKGLGAGELVQCMLRAQGVYHSKGQWPRLVRACMGQDFSWQSSARKYIELYSGLSGAGNDA